MYDINFMEKRKSGLSLDLSAKLNTKINVLHFIHML